MVELEMLSAKLTLLRESFIVLCIYRPPDAITRAICDAMADLLDELVLTWHRFVICGDVNCPGISQGSRDANLLDVLDRSSLTKHVSGATHDGGHACERRWSHHLRQH